MSTCRHLWETGSVAPRGAVCEACVALGDEWVHLRSCETCGNVGCCDMSKNKHASAHFRETGHRVARSIQPGESWRWCYEDEALDDPEELEMEGADLG
jgi:CPA2 family monovalent cation:H+ antiporter-2